MIYQLAAIFHTLHFVESKELETTWLQEDLYGGLFDGPHSGIKGLWPLCWESCLQTALPSGVSSLDEESHLTLCRAPALGSWLPKPDQRESLKVRPSSPPGRAGKGHPAAKLPVGWLRMSLPCSWSSVGPSKPSFAQGLGPNTLPNQPTTWLHPRVSFPGNHLHRGITQPFVIHFLSLIHLICYSFPKRRPCKTYILKRMGKIRISINVVQLCQYSMFWGKCFHPFMCFKYVFPSKLETADLYHSIYGKVPLCNLIGNVSLHCQIYCSDVRLLQPVWLYLSIQGSILMAFWGISLNHWTFKDVSREINIKERWPYVIIYLFYIQFLKTT